MQKKFVIKVKKLNSCTQVEPTLSLLPDSRITSSSMFISAECDAYDDEYSKKYHIPHHQTQMTVPQASTTLFNPLFTTQQYFDGEFATVKIKKKIKLFEIV